MVPLMVVEPPPAQVCTWHWSPVHGPEVPVLAAVVPKLPVEVAPGPEAPEPLLVPPEPVRVDDELPGEEHATAVTSAIGTSRAREEVPTARWCVMKLMLSRPSHAVHASGT